MDKLTEIELESEYEAALFANEIYDEAISRYKNKDLVTTVSYGNRNGRTNIKSCKNHEILVNHLIYKANNGGRPESSTYVWDKDEIGDPKIVLSNGCFYSHKKLELYLKCADYCNKICYFYENPRVAASCFYLRIRERRDLVYRYLERNDWIDKEYFNTEEFVDYARFRSQL